MQQFLENLEEINMRKILFLLFLIAFIIRLVVMSVIFYFPNENKSGIFLKTDGEGYKNEGWSIAQRWHKAPEDRIKKRVLYSYSYFNAVIFYLFGYKPAIPRIINCFFGALTVIFIYLITKEIFNKKIAILSSLLCSFFPSMVFWSAQNLKEASYMFCIISVIWIVIKLQTEDKKIKFVYFLLTIPLLFYLHFMKIYIFNFLAYAVILSFFITIRKKMIWKNIIYGICFIIIFSLIGKHMNNYSLLFKKPVKIVVETTQGKNAELSSTLVEINQIRKRCSTGGSVYKKNVDVSSPKKAIAFLPTGMTYFLFAPFPWQTKGLLQRLTIPEMLVWYLMVPFMLYGLFYALRFRWREISCILIYMGITIVLYSITLPNIGTFYRQRVAIIPFCLIFASIGIVHFSQFVISKRKMPAKEVV